MKKLTRLLAMVLSFTLLLTVTACGGTTDGYEDPNKGDANRTKTLSVAIFNGGYGMGWLYELKRGFEAIHSDVYIEISPYYSDSNARTEITSGVSETDIYFSKNHYYQFVDSGSVRIGKVMYDSYFADLSDVINGPAYGETNTIKSKLDKNLVDYLESSAGKYYAIPWASASLGFIVNTDILTENGWKIPVTTNEMFEVFDNIKNASLKNAQGQKISATTICTSDIEAVREILYTAFAQYNGTTGWDNFNQGIDENGEQYQPSLLNNKGILHGLEVCERMLLPKNEYLHKYALTDDFVTTEFRLFNKECVFLPYGDWVMNECANNFTEEELKDVRFVKYPVISNIVEKLDDTSMSDATLAKIIREIDNGATSSSLCSESDFARIKDARLINFNISNIHLAVCPSYSSNLDLAKEFLRYVFTNNGIETFAKNTRGNTMPVKYNYEGTSVTFNNYAASVNKIYQESENLLFYSAKHPLFKDNGLSMLVGSWYNFPVLFYSAEQKDRKTAKEVFEGNLVYATTRWDNYTKNLV